MTGDQVHACENVFSAFIAQPLPRSEIPVRQHLRNGSLLLSFSTRNNAARPRRQRLTVEERTQRVVERVLDQHEEQRANLLDVVRDQLEGVQSEMRAELQGVRNNLEEVRDTVQDNLGEFQGEINELRTLIEQLPGPQPSTSQPYPHGSQQQLGVPSNETTQERSTGLSQQQVWIAARDNAIGQAFIKFAVVQVIQNARERLKTREPASESSNEELKRMAMEDLPEFFQTALGVPAPMEDIRHVVDHYQFDQQAEESRPENFTSPPSQGHVLEDRLRQFLESKRMACLQTAVGDIQKTVSNLDGKLEELRRLLEVVIEKTTRSSHSSRDGAAQLVESESYEEQHPRKKARPDPIPLTPQSSEEFDWP